MLNKTVEKDRLIDILRELAAEIYPDKSVPPISGNTLLESDLGIDSLARVELIRRLENGLGIHLDEEAVIAAETVADLTEVCRHADEELHEGHAVAVAATPARLIEHKGFPEDAKTLIEALEWHQTTQGDNPFVHFYPGPIDDPMVITYRDLWDNARVVASGLRQLGIEPGQSVALMLPTSETFLYSFFGILMAGAVPVPVYPPQRLSQIEEHLKRQTKILENAEAVLLLTVTEGKQVGRYLKARLPKLIDVMTVEDLPPYRFLEILRGHPDDTAFMQYTSGSTGQPKGVVLTHANLLANVRAMGKALEVTPDDIFASWLPLYHDMGLIGAFLGSLYHGFQLVLMPPLSFIARPHRWLQAISKHRCTLSGSPNFGYEICATKIRDEDIEGVRLDSLRFTCNGAEPVSHETLEKFCQRFDEFGFNRGALSPVYGLAENSVGLAFPPLDRGPKVDVVKADVLLKEQRAEPTNGNDGNALHIVACGVAIPDHEMRVVNDKGETLPDRHIGMLEFRGPSATSGYYRNPEASATLFDNGWVNSGDYAYLVDGEVYIAGRSKDLIIRAGRNIYPYEIEQAVGELEGVRKGNVAVFSSMDHKLGHEKLVVLVETRERKPEKREQIKEQIREITMSLVQIPPDDIVLAPLRTVLKTSSGKIRRGDCKALYESGKIGKARSVGMQFFSLGLRAVGPFIKRNLIKLGSQLYRFYAWIMFLLLTLISWPMILILPGRRLPFMFMKLVLRPLYFLLGIGYGSYGRQNIPRDRSVILVSNHASYLDVFSLGLSLPPTFRFVAKIELSQKWFVRLILNKMNTHYVERFNAQQSVEDSDKILQSLKPGESVCFFPEGTFTRAPGLRPFKMGAFITAAKSGLPILPAALKGTRSVLRGADWHPKPGRIEAHYGPIIEPTGDDWDAAIEMRNEARKFILAHCGEPDITT